MPSDVVPIRQGGDIIEQVITKGDLAKLTPQERVKYYNHVCDSLGLNPFTRPLEFLTLSGKMVLYARRDAADQLRKINGISVEVVSQKVDGDMLTVHVRARDKTGRSDEDFGVVSIAGLRGEARANATLKCITKAKRRVTLSIAGLGFLDETEVDDIPAKERIDTAAELDQFAATTGEPEPPPYRDILGEAREIAELGTVAFRQHFAALSAAERAMLRPHMDEYQEIAGDADDKARFRAKAALKDNPDDPFGLPPIEVREEVNQYPDGRPGEPDEEPSSAGPRDVFGELDHAARAATREGVKAFRGWWKTVPRDDRDLLQPFLPDYERLAAEADAQRGLAL